MSRFLPLILCLLVAGVVWATAPSAPQEPAPGLPTPEAVAAKLAAGELVSLDTGGDLVIGETLVISRTAGGGIVGRSGGKTVGGGWLGTPGSRIVWAGAAGGTVVHLDRSIDALLSDLTIVGGGKAAVGVLMTSGVGFGTGGITLRRVTISGCSVAIQAGQAAGDINCADVVYDQVRFLGCSVGLRTMNDQSVNHHFRSLMAREVGVVFDFQRGGNLDVAGADVGTFDLLLRVGQGGPNAGKFRFASLRTELDGWSKRHSRLVDAASLPEWSMADIALVDCQETQGPLAESKADNRTDFLFDVGRGATITTARHVHSSRPVARVSGGSYRDEQSRWPYTAPSAATNWSRSGAGRIRVIDPSDVFGDQLPGVNRKP